MKSASSRTVTTTSARVASPWLIRSCSRPGVAMMTSTPRRSCWIWRYIGRAAVDGGELHADGLAERGQVVVHLLGQLAGRHQDQAARGAAALLDLGADAGEQRQAEGQRLARAGGGLAEHVAAGEGVGQRGGLDGERAADAAPLERGHQRLGQAQLVRTSGRSGSAARRCSRRRRCSRGVVLERCSTRTTTGWTKVMRGGAPIQLGARPVEKEGARGAPASSLAIAAPRCGTRDLHGCAHARTNRPGG